MGPQAAARTVANRLRLDPNRARSAGARAAIKAADNSHQTTTGQADSKQGVGKTQGNGTRSDVLSGREKPLPALPVE